MTARDLCLTGAPFQAPGDHEVDDDEDRPLELDDDALSHPSRARDLAARHDSWRWSHGAQHERIDHMHPIDALPSDQCVEALEVDDDVRELGHAPAWRSRELPLRPST